MSATYEQAKSAQPAARDLFSKIAFVRTVAVVRIAPDSFGLRVDLQNTPPRDTPTPATVEGVPIELRVSDDEIEAQGVI